MDIVGAGAVAAVVVVATVAGRSACDEQPATNSAIATAPAFIPTAQP
jgi:hypothetical protein